MRLEAATTTTTTILTVTPSGSVAAKQVATLAASVTDGSVPVTMGTVAFYDGKLYLGSAQVVRDPSHGYSVGTATLKTALRIGTHSIVATLLPTGTLASSSSTAQTVTVSPSTGLGAASLALAFASSGASTNTLFTVSLTPFETARPTGSIVFKDQTINDVLGSVPIDPAGFTNGYAPSISFASSLPERIFPLDLNGDGFPDMLVEEDPDFRGAMLTPYINGGNGTFTAGKQSVVMQGGLSSIVIADYNGDGIPDFATAGIPFLFGTGYEFDAYLGAGDGTFSAKQSLVPVSSTGNDNLQYAAVEDFNGDGIPDLTITDTTSAIAPILYIFPGKGDGTFGTPITKPGMVGVTSLVAGDFNHDGFADLAMTANNKNVVLVLLGKGDGTFQTPVLYPVGNMPVIGTALQSRGNGITDLAV